MHYFTHRPSPQLRHILQVAITITLLSVSGLLLGCTKADAALAKAEGFTISAETMAQCAAEGGCMLITKRAFEEITQTATALGEMSCGKAS